MVIDPLKVAHNIDENHTAQGAHSPVEPLDMVLPDGLLHPVALSSLFTWAAFTGSSSGWTQAQAHNVSTASYISRNSWWPSLKSTELSTLYSYISMRFVAWSPIRSMSPTPFT